MTGVGKDSFSFSFKIAPSSYLDMKCLIKEDNMDSQTQPKNEDIQTIHGQNPGQNLLAPPELELDKRTQLMKL
jgi:hypothetical protein